MRRIISAQRRQTHQSDYTGHCLEAASVLRLADYTKPRPATRPSQPRQGPAEVAVHHWEPSGKAEEDATPCRAGEAGIDCGGCYSHSIVAGGLEVTS